MSAIMVSYDLNSPGQKYEKLYEKLRAFGTYAKVVNSTWIVSGYGLTPQSVYDTLRPILDDNDHIFTVDITNDPKQGWLPQDVWDWIHKNL